MGLISFIPRSEISGLQCVNNDLNKWIAVEKQCDENDLIMIVGQTLARLSGYFFFFFY